MTSLYLSFGKVTDLYGLKTQFVGMVNYRELFTADIKFLPAFWNTAVVTFIWTPFIIVFSLLVSILLNQKIRLRGFFRVIYFLPVLLGSGFVMQRLGAGSISKFMVLPENWIEFIRIYFNPAVANILSGAASNLLSIFWRSGIQIVIFLAGLQSIPETYSEAARVEGAGAWTFLWKVTLPALSPIILLNTVFTLVDSFRDSDNAIAKLIISVSFENSNYEYGAAMGWIYFMMVLLMIGTVMLLSKRFVIEN